MRNQAGIFKAGMCAVAVSVVTAVFAQDAKPGAAQPAVVPATEQTPPAKLFEPLLRVITIRGVCEVKNPDVGSYQPAVNNKAYPLGSTFRTGLGGSAVLVFSDQESVQVFESSEVVGINVETTPASRILRLVSGRVKTVLRENLPDGSFTIETPNANCRNLAGRSEYTLSADAALETLQVSTVTGSARIEGSQFQIQALRAANTVNIQTATDRSLSRLSSVSGDFMITLENGTETPVQFGMTPKAVVKIWRENAPVGGRPIISVLVVGATGLACHRFAYAEGRANLATGELVVQPEPEENDKDLPVLLSTDGKKAETPAAKLEKRVEPPAAKGEKVEAP